MAILSWNTRELLGRCLAALEADAVPGGREVLVIDHASADGSADMVASRFPRVRLFRRSENRGYSRGVNEAAEAAEGRFLCLLGSDTEVRKGALSILVDHLDGSPAHAAAAPRLVGPAGEVQRSCMSFPGLLTALTFDNLLARFPPGRWVQDRYYLRSFDHLSSRDVAQPPGTCFVLERALFLSMGGLDPNLFLFFNDVDFCRRLHRGGRRIRYVAEAEVLHHGGASTTRYGRMVVQWHLDRLAYYRKWYGRWVGPLIKLLVLERALEERHALIRRHPQPQARAAAAADLWSAVKEVLRA